MKHIDTPIVVANIVVLVLLIASAVVALVIVPVVNARRVVTPTLAPMPTLPPTETNTNTPRPTLTTTRQTPTATRTPLPTLLPSGTPTPTATRPASCVALPGQPVGLATRTPTPAGNPLSPSPTSLPVTQNFDLDPNLPVGEKTQVIVFRCDGIWAEYLLGPSRSLDSSVQLGAGDIIWAIIPAATLPTQSPSPTP